MKPKGHWIKQHIFENQDEQSTLSNTAGILKVNVKPKDAWLIRHVILKESQTELEEGEILSDDDEGEIFSDNESEAEVVNLNPTDVLSFACEEKIETSKKVTNVYENPVEYSYAEKDRLNYGINWRQSYSDDKRCHQFQNSKHSKYHQSNREIDWNIKNQYDRRHRRPFDENSRNGYH